jgi:hypothetical protein
MSATDVRTEHSGEKALDGYPSAVHGGVRVISTAQVQQYPRVHPLAWSPSAVYQIEECVLLP